MANANFTSIEPSQFDGILHDLSISRSLDFSISQMLADDAGQLSRKLYTSIDFEEIHMRLQSIAAVCKQSVGLNARSHEKLQEIFAAISAASASPPAQPQT